MIYDILLLSPEAIPISRTRRLQLTRGQPTHGKPAHSRESTHEESTHGHTPSDSLEKCTPRWKPETAILRTCKQIDYEATRILYSKNEFHVSCKSYQCTTPSPLRRNHSLFTDSHHRSPVRIHASHQVLSLRPTSVDTLLSEAFDLSCRLLLSQMGRRKPDRVENHGRRPPQDTLSTLLSENVTSFAKESATG